jgi:hypothetical protein
MEAAECLTQHKHAQIGRGDEDTREIYEQATHGIGSTPALGCPRGGYLAAAMTSPAEKVGHDTVSALPLVLTHSLSITATLFQSMVHGLHIALGQNGPKHSTPRIVGQHPPSIHQMPMRLTVRASGRVIPPSSQW